MSSSQARKADGLLVIVTLLAAISWIFSKEAVLLMPPLLFMAVRFLLAGSLLALAGRKQLMRLTPEQLFRGIRVGLVFGVAMSCWITGLFLTDNVGEGAFLTSLGVVFVPVIARIVFKEAQPLSTWLALPVAIAGLALLSLKNGFRPEPGQLFFVIAAAIFALYFTLNTHAANSRTYVLSDGTERHRERLPALALTAIALLTVGCVTLLASSFREPWHPTLSDFSAVLAGWVIASAVVGTAGRFLLQTYAQSLSTNSHGVVILVLEPVWVALFAAGWFGESMSATQLGGCSLIFGSLLINRWSSVRKLLRGL
ncbi:DMT family transporter [Marinobacter sp. BGYM27]|uniref:DMT family transporter n=1 Tax=Marinobacter sp. BGYM27 TaxID=2975597 RepID=UPI0021A6E98F|nr:DMT family transporter [Marinobacter sp. BGYM27]MDG5498981.1 DMT family transporter [Marinobacter sp. BGYM27]